MYEVQLCKFAFSPSPFVLPDTQDGEVVSTMPRSLKVFPDRRIVPVSGSLKVLFNTRFKGTVCLPHIHHQDGTAALSTDDAIDDICRLAGELLADSERPFWASDDGCGVDIPADPAPGTQAWVRACGS